MNLQIRRSPPFVCSACLALLLNSAARLLGANASVNIGDYFFSPASSTVNVGEQVTWTWVGNIVHSATATGGLWDSGINGKGSTYSFTFNTAGSYPYYCVVHPFMKGSVTVNGAQNLPPTVSINSPTNGTVFAAPWNGVMAAADSDSDGSVARVDFYAGTRLLGSVTSPAATISFAATNLAAGNYALHAVATDNLGATNSSAIVNVTVVTAAPIHLGAPHYTGQSSFGFTFGTQAGLRYVIRRAQTLPNWSAIATNTATSSSITFSDPSTRAAAFYSVTLLP